MKIKKINVFLMIFSIFMCLGTINVEAKSCYEYKTKKTCNKKSNSSCTWVDNKCRVKKCSSLSSSTCGKNTDKNKKKCQWNGSTCCPNGNCGNSTPYNTTIEDNNKDTNNYICNYKQGSTKFKLTASSNEGEYVLEKGSSKETIKVFTSQYEENPNGSCGAIDAIFSGNDICKDIVFTTPYRSALGCGYYLYKVTPRTSESYYVAGPRNPADIEAFEGSYELIGELESYIDKNGNKKEPNDPIVSKTEAEKANYKDFYEGVDKKYLKCGSLEKIPTGLPKFTKNLYTLVKVIVPIILIVLGMIDFARAVVSNKEENMNQSSKRFVRRIAAAVIIFMIFALTQFLVKISDAKEKSDMLTCMKCFMLDEEKCSEYSE